MENKIKTRTKVTPGVVEVAWDGDMISVPAENYVYAHLIKRDYPFEIYWIIMNFYIIQN